jgi:hypothetical protein
MYPKDFSPVMAIGLVLICVYLLTTAKLTGWQFGFALIASLFVVIGLHNIDGIGKLSVKGGGVDAVVEMRELRDEVYAKVDELKKVAAGIGTFIVESIVSENRYVDEDHAERMLRRRDDLDQFLRDAGISEPQRAQTIAPITRWADWDLRRKIVSNARAYWRLPKGSDPNDPGERDRFADQVRHALEQPDRLKGVAEAEALVRHLYDDGNPTLKSSVETYRRLLTTGRIPAHGPLDDLTKPPR